MMKKLLIAFSLFCIATPAAAEDFTITVPVEFNNLPPNIHTLWVTCQVMEEVRARVTAVASRAIPVSGSYRGDVVLAANASADRDPGRAVQYRCVAWLRGRTATNPELHYFSSLSPTDVNAFPLAAGAPFVLDTGEVRFR